MSEYVRRRDKGVCFTCGDRKPWKEQHAGHYIHKRLDFNEMNINCQCVSCNKFRHGNLAIYTLNLIKKYGLNRVGVLVEESRRVKKWTILELEEIQKELYGRLHNKRLRPL